MCLKNETPSLRVTGLREDSRARTPTAFADNQSRRNDQHCHECGRALPRRRQGRPPIFCSSICRKAAFRKRRSGMAGISSPATLIAHGMKLPSEQSIKTTSYKAQSGDLYPSNKAPIEILGCGYRWPNTTRLDAKLRQNILWCEATSP
jgi:hypothetical protein